ncbi:unnamed protein product [Linum tenue]|uniref:PHD-type domain-containing protein n=1 Tax=Linum tenue TaxID=586396 RepID=A0AAV0H1Z3_9ROSI|nr:unnamed protein product [Linum tenue]
MNREGNGEAAALPEPKLDAGGEADSVAEKMQPTATATEVENEDVGRDTKRLKKNSAGEMRQVAEMLLVLSAMGQMRGGRDPTEAEEKLMVEAKDKLAEICQRFAPKELVAGDAVGKVIEDLGLNWKLNDQRLGFRGSRMSIKEKVAHAKRKMEEPKKVTPHASQTSHPSFAVIAEGRVPTHTIRPLPLEKPTHAPLLSGTAPVHHPPFTHVSATAAYLQASNAEAKGAAASGRLPITHLGSSSVVAAPRGQFIKVEGGPNANTYTLNLVQKLLQPKLPEHPTWTPPSREYMNKALTCQSCNLTINEVDNVIICDACEKGFHLKCLESVLQKAVPRAEWHCMKCTSLSNGKPFPPKYGRVMRSITPPKGPASATQVGAQSLSDKKLVNMGQRGVQDKMSSVLESVTESGSAGCVNLVSGTKIDSERGLPRNSITSKGKDMGLMPSAGTLQNEADPRKPPGHDLASVALAGETCSQQIQSPGSPIHDKRSTSELKLDPPALLSSHIHDTYEAKSQHNVQDVAETGAVNTAKDLLVTCQVGTNAEETKITYASGYDVKQIEEGDSQTPSHSLNDDKQSEVDVARLPGSKHDVKQSGQAVDLAPSASEQKVKQDEQPVPFASEQNVKQSELDVGHAPSASEHNNEQNQPDVEYAPSLSEQNAALGVGHVPSALEHNVKQREQGVARAEHNSKQSGHGVAHGPSASEHNIQQTEQGVSPVPASEHNAERSQQGVDQAPSSEEENGKQIELGGVLAPSKHNFQQSEQGVSTSEQNVEQTVQVVAHASSVEQNVEQGVAHVPSAEQNVEQGVAHAPSAEHNVEQTEQVVAHAHSGSEHNVDQSEQGVAHVPSASQHNFELQSEPAVAHAHPGNSTNGSSMTVQLSAEVLQTVEWVGSALNVFDDKAFYESCCIGGVVYKVLDHALFHSSHAFNLRFQSMWEDMKTGSKWIRVSTCYSREDLPEGVGQPFSPESNEVYDSNHEISVMAGLIQGSCKVLPPVAYKEESERRSQLAAEINNKSEPVFLCKYVYLFTLVLYSCGFLINSEEAFNLFSVERSLYAFEVFFQQSQTAYIN